MPPPLRQLNPHVSLVLEHLVLKMLDKDPSKRYHNIRQIRGILANINTPSRRYSHHPTYPRMREPMLIDRTKPMQQLQKLWQKTQQGRGQLSFITAESGFGKNRLLREFSHQLSSVPFIIASFDPHKRLLPYSPLAEALEDYLSRDHVSPAMRQLAQKIAAVIPTTTPIINVEATEPTTDEITTVTLTTYLKQAIANQPTLFIWEDLQWADTSSLYLLDYLARCCHEMPLMIVASYCHTSAQANPFLEEILKRHAVDNTLSLVRFNRETVRAYLTTYWSSQVSQPIIDALAQRSQGNPLYIEQILLGLIDEGVITYQNNSWHFDNVTIEHLPSTRDEILPRRVKRLSKEIQTLLSQASILGQHFKLTELLEMSYLPEKNVLESLDIALERQLIKADPHDSLLRFSHPEIRSAFYNKLSLLERRRMHFEAGEVLERLYETQKLTIAPLLAYHFQQAGDTERVLIYSQQAGQQAEQMQANTIALNWYNTAWQAMNELETPLEPNPHLELLLARERLHQRLGQHDEQKADLAALTEHWQSLSPRQQALVMQPAAAHARLQGQWAEAHDHAQASLIAAQQANDTILRGESLIQLGYLALAQGHFDIARKELDTAYTILAQAHNPTGEAHALHGLGLVCQHLKEFAQAESYYKQALTRNQADRDWAHQATSLYHLGNLYFTSGDLAQAEIYSQYALEINRIIGYHIGINLCIQTLSSIKSAKGKA